MPAISKPESTNFEHNNHAGEFQKESSDSTQKMQRKSKRSVQQGFLNPGLEKEEGIDKQLQNLKIATDTDRVIAKELLQYQGVDWDTLKITKRISDVLKSAGYKFPSPVQHKVIPDILNGDDVLVKSKNGSGKTLSYLIPALQRIDLASNELQVIIITPVRELALQVARFARFLCKDLGIKSAPLIGGSSVVDDIIRISMGVHILIGTPGRLFDILSRNLCTVKSNPLIIFDEADKLLDSSMFEAVYKIMNQLPKKKQMCLFSATFPTSTKSFIELHMNSPKMIWVNKDCNLTNITQMYAKVDSYSKDACLMSLLGFLEIKQCIVYVKNSSSAERIAQDITKMGKSCYFIHSYLNQDERNEIIDSFAKNKTQILVSTDLTTRGMDVNDVNVVINYDLPLSSETYLHRLGRSGRFGTKGCCISLIRENETQCAEAFANFVGSPIVPCTPDVLKKFSK